MKRNLLLTIEYDGTNFSGWQRQPNVRTVQGQLEQVLSILCGGPVVLNGTSRTDAGVHAFGQRATLIGEFGIPTDKLSIAANNLLAENSMRAGDVRIISVEEKPESFHARFNAVGKRYLYRIYNATDMPVFLRNYVYQVRKNLNIENMVAVADLFKGAHDFKGFMATGGTPQKSTVRTIHGIRIIKKEKVVEIEVIGDGFLYNMVRIIAGTLVDVGLGKLSSANVLKAIQGGRRADAGHTAPPQGLYLSEVFYDPQELLCDK